MKNKSNIIKAGFLCALWGIITLACLFSPLKEESKSERRKLAVFPELSAQSLLSGKFQTDFETFSLDQFPLRDSFRSLKARSVFYLFRQKDNNDIFIENGYASKIEYPLNYSSLDYAADKFSYIYETYLSENFNIYLSIVPDKSYFLAEKGGYPSFSYTELFDYMKNAAPFAEYIDIKDTLSVSSYYKTDTHWRQEEIVETAKKLAASMGVSEYFSGEFEKQLVFSDFYGVYYGQSALPLEKEQIYCLSNTAIENADVYNAETEETGKIYNFEKLSGKDPYDFFLSGASPIIKITNENAEKERRLIVFRDSFGSSLIPLLCECYSEIDVVDIRYIKSDLLSDYINFEGGGDVLFLYSTSILNQSNTLK